MTAISQLEVSWGLPPDVSAGIEALSAWPTFDAQDTSITSGAWLTDLYARIATAVGEADNGSLIEESTVGFARMFARLLPSGLPLPEVCLEADGDIEFEWYFGPRRVFSVSVRRDGSLSYAALAGPARDYGSDTLLQGIPRRIIEYISMVSR